MPSTYRYTGDVPTVFTTLVKDGKTWTPETGDTIRLESPIAHPLLELVVKESKKAALQPEQETVNEPATPGTTESPATDDTLKEN